MKNKKIKLLASCISTIAAIFGATYSITSTSKEVKDNSSNIVKLNNSSVNTPVLNSSESDYEFDFRDLVKDDCRSSVSGKIRCLIDRENKWIRLLDASNGSIKGANVKFANLISLCGESYTITSIAPNAFKNVTTLTGTIEFPSSLKSVGDYAFQGCNKITGSIILPTTVTYIGDYAFHGCNQITGLTIPSLVKYIGSYAFQGCSNIANSVVIPNEITEILPFTFQGCSKLTEVILSSKITKIGNEAFNKCVKLANIVLPNSLVEIGDFVFNSCTSLVNVNIPDSVELIGPYAFSGCSNLTDVNINEETSNLKKIDRSAFEYAEKLKMINFPKKLEFIGEQAFYGDTAFVGTPKIPESVTEIGYNAFELTGCDKKAGDLEVAYSYEGKGYAKWILASSFLTKTIDHYTIENNTIGIAGGAINEKGEYFTGELTLGSINNRTLKYIGDSAFAFNAFSSIVGLEYTQIKTIGKHAFADCSNLSGTIIIPNTIEKIGDCAFLVTNISSLIISPDVTRTTKCTIGKEAFLLCPSLSGTLNIPTYVSEIGIDAFKGTALTKDAYGVVYSSEGQIGFNKWCIGTIDRALLFNYLELDSNVYGIANGAFLGYGSLIKVKIGDNTEIIGDKAFYDCKNISTLDLGHGKLKTIGHSAFAGCYSIPTNPLNQESQKSLESIGNSAFGWCTGMSGTLTLGNANENKLSKIGDYAFANCLSLSGKLKIYGVNGLDLSGSGTFADCNGLNSVEIFNDSIKTIGNGIFNGCSKIENIRLPKTITNIGANAFSNCTSLTQINIPQQTIAIGTEAFSGCSSLKAIHINDKIETIGDSAFENCYSLASKITFPTTVKSIGSKAFIGDVKIEKITFQSSLAPRLGIDWLTSMDDPNMNTIIEIPYNEDPNYTVASYFDGNVSAFLENVKYFDLNDFELKLKPSADDKIVLVNGIEQNFDLFDIKVNEGSNNKAHFNLYVDGHDTSIEKINWISIDKNNGQISIKKQAEYGKHELKVVATSVQDLSKFSSKIIKLDITTISATSNWWIWIIVAISCLTVIGVAWYVIHSVEKNKKLIHKK